MTASMTVDRHVGVAVIDTDGDIVVRVAAEIRDSA